jgi:hypothetical protein
LIEKLEGAADYDPCEKGQDQLFATISNTDMDKLTRADLLHDLAFKNIFKTNYGAAFSEDSENNKRNPFTDAGFLQQCHLYATIEGKGWQPWVPDLCTDVCGALCDAIKAKTSLVPRGDLIRFFAAIRLAVLHCERYDETTLELELVQLTLEFCNSNVMQFLATVAT